MAVPSSATYSAAALIAANTSFKTLLDAGSGPAVVKLRDAADALLATVTMTDPCGTVNGTTGQLMLTMAGDATASASGTAWYAELCDSAGLVHLSIPTQAGTAAVVGKLVLNTLSIVAGGAVRVVSASIG
jgi:hypothetical protein